jgi:hypothetical protein
MIVPNHSMDLVFTLRLYPTPSSLRGHQGRQLGEAQRLQERVRGEEPQSGYSPKRGILTSHECPGNRVRYTGAISNELNGIYHDRSEKDDGTKSSSAPESLVRDTPKERQS